MARYRAGQCRQPPDGRDEVGPIARSECADFDPAPDNSTAEYSPVFNMVQFCNDPFGGLGLNDSIAAESSETRC
jgi:hypothetical protein